MDPALTLAQDPPAPAARPASPGSPTSPTSTPSTCPVAVAIRPASGTLAVEGGKGITRDAAFTSAAMEGIERYVAEEALGRRRRRHGPRGGRPAARAAGRLPDAAHGQRLRPASLRVVVDARPAHRRPSTSCRPTSSDSRSTSTASSSGTLGRQLQRAGLGQPPARGPVCGALRGRRARRAGVLAGRRRTGLAVPSARSRRPSAARSSPTWSTGSTGVASRSTCSGARPTSASRPSRCYVVDRRPRSRCLPGASAATSTPRSR